MRFSRKLPSLLGNIYLTPKTSIKNFSVTKKAFLSTGWTESLLCLSASSSLESSLLPSSAFSSPFSEAFLVASATWESERRTNNQQEWMPVATDVNPLNSIFFLSSLIQNAIMLVVVKSKVKSKVTYLYGDRSTHATNLALEWPHASLPSVIRNWNKTAQGIMSLLMRFLRCTQYLLHGRQPKIKVKERRKRIN